MFIIRKSQSTLPLALHDRAIGQVVDHLVVQITKDIIELTDISEAESYQLHKACQMLFELANLFRIKDRQVTIFYTKYRH
jgi:hypothetical protein